MTSQNNPYRITELFGDKPFAFATAENADVDKRYRIDVTCTCAGKERRRVYLSRTRPEAIYALPGPFFDPGRDDDAARDVEAKGQNAWDGEDEPPF